MPKNDVRLSKAQKVVVQNMQNGAWYKLNELKSTMLCLLDKGIVEIHNGEYTLTELGKNIKID